MAFPWVETSTGPGGFMICVFIIWRELSTFLVGQACVDL